VAAPPPLAEVVKTGGYPFAEFASPPEEEQAEARSRIRLVPPEDREATRLRESFGRLRPRASLPVLNEVCRSWRPDIVVRDRAEFGSALAAELHEIPVVRVSRLASFEHHVMRLCADPLDELRRTVGLPSDPGAERLRRAPSATFWPVSLEDAADPAPPHTVRFRDPNWDSPAKQLDYEWGEAAGPLIYMTFGTVTGQLDFAVRVYGTAIEAVANLPVRALLTAGGRPEAIPDSIDDSSHNIRVETWVNEVDVLPESTIVVCHGGAGSILGALGAGLPLVIVPLFADQHVNARLVAAAGAGVVAELDVHSLRSAILDVLHHDDYRPHARAISDELHMHAPSDTFVELLTNLTADSTDA